MRGKGFGCNVAISSGFGMKLPHDKANPSCERGTGMVAAAPPDAVLAS